jgi:hypothetical protein
MFLKVISMPDAQDKGEMLLDCYEDVINIYNRMGQPDMAKMFVEKRDALRAEKERVLSA